MSVTGIESIVDRLQHSANVRAVFGEPVERGDQTVVPVARVYYGFGGGFGQSDGGTNDGDDGDGESGEHGGIGGNVGSRDGRSGGGGGGGGASATPVGALEITDDGTRFVRIGSGKRSVATALLAGVAVGLLVGRRSSRE